MLSPEQTRALQNVTTFVVTNQDWNPSQKMTYQALGQALYTKILQHSRNLPGLINEQDLTQALDVIQAHLLRMNVGDGMKGEIVGALLRKIVSSTPQGKAGYMAYDNRGQANRLAKVAKSKNASPKTAATAKVLARAKMGDPKAKKTIIDTQKMAKAGDPNAKAAVARLKVLNAGTKSRGLNRLYDHGIS